MSKYNIYVIADGGDGTVQPLADWDGEKDLEIHLEAFAHDAVIAVMKEES